MCSASIKKLGVSVFHVIYAEVIEMTAQTDVNVNIQNTQKNTHKFTPQEAV